MDVVCSYVGGGALPSFPRVSLTLLFALEAKPPFLATLHPLSPTIYLTGDVHYVGLVTRHVEIITSNEEENMLSKVTTFFYERYVNAKLKGDVKR